MQYNYNMILTKIKLFSTLVGKGGTNGQQTWGLDNDDDGPQIAKTNIALFRRMQEELEQLRKEKATWQQQPQTEPQQGNSYAYAARSTYY